jgi:hypothetical protein
MDKYFQKNTVKTCKNNRSLIHDICKIKRYGSTKSEIRSGRRRWLERPSLCFQRRPPAGATVGCKALLAFS